MNPPKKVIDEKTVKHVALLSRLALNDEELALYSKQLASVLSYINKLNEVGTKDVLPTSHVLSTLKNVFRKDVVKPSLGCDEALRPAPSREGDFFKVPQVIEGKYKL
ncbi:MAG: asparaginyl/glutamyl-tRNA amidotransferase subunit C [Omnitrophica bacterium RIFCSPLOWO2_01_FULL_45_10]|nr:MAG: asparaginyl/glutamyl-tRNA amidotransferase subunit C [Omnitrophica bacterium RIFCSPLOWO2_01_FULL_45_10]